MKIILHNPSHNGDQFFTLGIISRIIKDNLDKDIVIVPACAMYIYNELLADNVKLEKHPVIWDNTKNIHLDQNFIARQHNVLWNYHEGDIYINLWKLLVIENNNCVSLVNRPAVIKELLQTIYTHTGFIINFNCDNYKELIPVLPNVDIEIIHEKIKSYNKKIIFFYNQNSYCGLENSYSSNINEIIIKNLIDNNVEDTLIILSKPSSISHKNLINVETEFGNIPVLDGKNLIINAYIANLCDDVFFKNNGGSLFVLNEMNISNKNVNYHFVGTTDFYNVISNEYGLNCKHVSF